MFFKKRSKENEVPCSYCRYIKIPEFLRCDISRVQYGLLAYEDVRPDIVFVLNRDMPHEACKKYFLNLYDRQFLNRSDD